MVQEAKCASALAQSSPPGRDLRLQVQAGRLRRNHQGRNHMLLEEHFVLTLNAVYLSNRHLPSLITF